jgi:hypothetical protein
MSKIIQFARTARRGRKERAPESAGADERRQIIYNFEGRWYSAVQFPRLGNDAEDARDLADVRTSLELH